MIEPIVREITVSADPAEAFIRFTAHFGDWWPLTSHSLSASAGNRAKAVVMEPGIGGTIVETMFDGDTVTWGAITDWQPGRKVAFTWHLRRPEDQQTYVSVTFSPVENGTLVRLVHSGWDRFGEDAQSNRDEYYSGWGKILQNFYKVRFSS